MTREEHKKILGFLQEAVRPDNNLAEPPLDVEADAIIRAYFVRNPEAAYRITLLAIAQADQLAAMSGQATELPEAKPNFRQGWLARLLKKQQGRERRRDPRLAGSTQNSRNR